MVSLSLPATLSSEVVFKEEKAYVSLKVLFIGETGDGRIITEAAAESLKASLPGTPVVGYYSELQKDFIGHNSTQYVYGVVPADAENKFEEDENGNTWLMTEVMLFTNRTDNIGEVANKIVGCAQSMEMDPSTVEYEIVEEDGKQKIKFTKATLIGLSVLGSSQKPAFNGSEFFSEQDYAALQERCAQFTRYLDENTKLQDEQKKIEFQRQIEFMRVTYNEKTQMLEDFINEQLGETGFAYVLDLSDTVVFIYRFDQECNKFLEALDYILEDSGEIKLSNTRSAVYKLLTEEELQVLQNASFACGDDKKKIKGGMNEQAQQPEQKQQEFTTITPLNNSEREELENYRKEEKRQLIIKYSTNFPEEVIAEFNNSIDLLDKETLEGKLAIANIKYQKQINTPFILHDAPVDNNRGTTYEDIVKRVLKK